MSIYLNNYLAFFKGNILITELYLTTNIYIIYNIFTSSYETEMFFIFIL